MTKRKIGLTVLILFLVSLCFVLICFAGIKFLFWEPSNIKKGSVVYRLKIPKYAREYPIWNAKETPLYSFRIADGEKPQVVIIRYISNDTYETLSLIMEKNNIENDGKTEFYLRELPEGCLVEVIIFSQ